MKTEVGYFLQNGIVFSLDYAIVRLLIDIDVLIYSATYRLQHSLVCLWISS